MKHGECYIFYGFQFKIPNVKSYLANISLHLRKNHAFLFFPIKSCVQSSKVRLYDRTRFNGKIITHTHTFHLHTLFLTNIFFLSYSIQQTIADMYFSKDTNEWNHIKPRHIPPWHRTQKIIDWRLLFFGSNILRLKSNTSYHIHNWLHLLFIKKYMFIFHMYWIYIYIS